MGAFGKVACTCAFLAMGLLAQPIAADLDLPETTITSGTATHQVGISITAGNGFNGFKVNNSASDSAIVTFEAGSLIRLVPGFRATAGTAPATTFRATIIPVAYLTTGVYPPGAGTISPASGWYRNPTTSVPVSATANSGYQFWPGFSGNLSGATTPQYLTVTGTMGVTANFTALLTAPGPVGLVSPVNYALLSSGATATFTWHAATNATYYDIYLGIVSQSISQVGHVVAPTTQFIVGILPSTSYSWCVVATNAAGSSTSCANFTTPPSRWFSGQ